MALSFPPALRASSQSFRLAGVSRSGGASLSGIEQVVVSPAAYWRARLVLPLHRREAILAFRGLMAGLSGRAGTVLVPACEASRAPWFVSASGVRDLVVQAVTATGAPLRATRLDVTVDRGRAIERGQYLSVGGRLHVVVTASRAGVTDLLTIAPPLRAAVPAGAQVELVRPACEMRLASDDEGEVDLDLARFGTATLNFIEAF